ncbi:hypothetical protein TNIN_79461 [Trichonephila inaurata madagascariensis]|uniref:Uncharacterized protein n=1 Tax=Trichonephila inaurata madagascariensis TaxID=2747483 RepID=A0A8X7CDM0_9ARAC|nr:hypothetical protein TNIN_79461 [Trichonephila inaurata madagascariensis]
MERQRIKPINGELNVIDFWNDWELLQLRNFKSNVLKKINSGFRLHQHRSRAFIDRIFNAITVELCDETICIVSFSLKKLFALLYILFEVIARCPRIKVLNSLPTIYDLGLLIEGLFINVTLK